MAEYSYQLQDLASGQPLADLPLSCSSLPRNISGDASTSFTCDLGDSRVRKLDPVTATAPGRTALFALRDGVPVWGGIVWGRSYKAATTTLTINASTVESYWRHRYWAVVRNYVNADQLAIAAGMWLGVRPVNGATTWQLTDGSATVDTDPFNGETDSDGTNVAINVIPANIRGSYYYDAGVDSVFSGVPPGITRTISYQPGKNVYDALTELAALDNGFEWTCDPTRFADGSLGWQMRFASLQLGRTEDVTGLHFEYTQGLYDQETKQYLPGLGSNILDYEAGEDALAGANHLIVTGREESSQVTYKVAGHLPSLRAGYPLLEVGTSYADANADNIASKSIGDLADAPLPAEVSTWTVRADGDFGFGTAQLGDRGVFAVSDLFTPRQTSGLAGRYSVERIVGWTLVPEQRDQPERWQLTTNPVTQASARLPRSEARRLEQMERRINAAATMSRVAQTKTYGWAGTTTAVANSKPTASAAGNWNEISEISFVKQGDILTVYIQLAAITSSSNPVTFETRIITNVGILPSLVAYNATNAPTADRWWIQFSLDAFNYGDIINGTLQTRVAAYPGIGSFDAFSTRLSYLVTGLPFHS